MKVLRASPFRAWVVASALQVFILSCWVATGAGVALRQLLIKVLRSSPLRVLALAVGVLAFVLERVLPASANGVAPVPGSVPVVD